MHIILITRNARILSQILNFGFPQNIFEGAPQFWNLSYKVPPSSHCLAKFGGDRPRGLRDFAPKPFTPIFGGEGEAPQI